MKVYDKTGRFMEADSDQMEILIEAGWSTIQPEVKPDLDTLKKRKEEADKALAEAQIAADKEAALLEKAEDEEDEEEEDSPSKPKRIRKINPKK